MHHVTKGTSRGERHTRTSDAAVRTRCLEAGGWLDTGAAGVAGSELHTGFWSKIKGSGA